VAKTFRGTLVGNASTVTVSNSDSNSSYRMVWHSSNSLYSTAGIYCNPSTDSLYASFIELSRTSDHGLKVGSIRGTAVGSLTG
jgi:ABC-type transport system substrate-binding protein